MKTRLKKAVTALVALALAVSIIPGSPSARAAYQAPYDTVRIGIYTYYDDGNIKEKSFPWANLQNVSGLGYGYELGYYDENRVFVPIGARIEDTNEISVIMDRNMSYNSGSNSYSEGESGSVVVGCYHLRLATFNDYAGARALADTVEGSFIRYENDAYAVMAGNYKSLDAAAAASASAGYYCTIDSGSAYTVTVVQTRTNRVLFEFDCGSRKNLAVRPLAPQGVKAQTWHRECMYYGGFAFLRNTGGNITTVNYVDVEDYVKGVICYEMSPSWPVEALKAQAISARTYLMSHTTKHKTEGFDICNTIHCQAYHGTNRATAVSDAAVDATMSQYLTYDGLLCDIYYAASNGGASESSENVWTQKLPYLRGVVDPYEKDVAATVSGYYWTKTYTPSSLGAQLRSKGYNCSDIVKVDIVFTDVGNVYSITFTDKNGVKNTASKANARGVIGGTSIHYTVNGLGPSADGSFYVNEGIKLEGGLESAYVMGPDGIDAVPAGNVYAISGSGEVTKLEASVGGSKTVSTGVNSSGKFVFTGSGNGHNVGMSQWGAYSMAKYHNMTCEDILTFYYTGTEISTSY